MIALLSPPAANPMPPWVCMAPLRETAYLSRARMDYATQLPRSDADLVAALASGRQDALAQLYDRYAGLLMAVGLRILAHRIETEDVLHDVFVEAWRSAGQYQAARGSVRAWLVTRMRSRCLDRRKSAVVSRSVPLDAAGPERAAPQTDPSLQEDSNRLKGALDRLPAEQRVVVELGYFEGLSCSEIAERIGVPVGTVKSRMAASLSKLRGALDVEIA